MGGVVGTSLWGCYTPSTVVMEPTDQNVGMTYVVPVAGRSCTLWCALLHAGSRWESEGHEHDNLALGPWVRGAAIGGHIALQPSMMRRVSNIGTTTLDYFCFFYWFSSFFFVFSFFLFFVSLLLFPSVFVFFLFLFLLHFFVICFFLQVYFLFYFLRFYNCYIF